MITREAEEKLCRLAGKIKDSPTGWSIISIAVPKSFQDKYQETPYHSRIIANIIRDEISMTDRLNVFFCLDASIVVVCKGAKKETMLRAGEMVAAAINDNDKAQKPEETTAAKAEFMDLSVHQDTFHELCAQKLIEAEKQRNNEDTDREVLVNNLQKLASKGADFSKMRSHPRRRLMIMFVEDDPSTRQLLIRIIESETTCETLGAANALDAVETYTANAPDIVFLDINLPSVNGFELLSIFLEMDPSAFVVMLSANSSQANVKRAVEMGAAGFVAKPFTPKKLKWYISKSGAN